MIAADDRRVAGWRVVREYLRDGASPSLVISSSCHELIHSMSSLQYDKIRNEDASNEPHSITHAPEALRYGLMSRIVQALSHRNEKETDLLTSFLGYRRTNSFDKLFDS